MPYDEGLGRRLRDLLGDVPGSSERRMFGGLCFMLSGRMCCGVVGKDLVVRVGADAYEPALRERHARPMDFTGRPLRGFVYVAPAGCRTDRALGKWIRRAVEFLSGLPAQRRRPSRRGRQRGRAPA